MARWKRECREVDEGLSEVERENKELEDIADDPSKIAMQKAKLEVYHVVRWRGLWFLEVRGGGIRILMSTSTFLEVKGVTQDCL